MREAAADPPYGYNVHLAGTSHETAKARVTEALEVEGFGILTEIDVRATFKKKLDLEFRPYTILGACNPALAARALGEELGVGLLLPCNVCVWEEPGGSVISIARPDLMFQVVGRAEIAPLAAEVDARLRRVVEGLQRSTGAEAATPLPA
jgi:uncharacterized protein (DUF302 family)